MNPVIVFVIILAVTAVVALVAFILYRILRPRLKEDKPSEEQILEDENVAKQISDYKDDE